MSGEILSWYKSIYIHSLKTVYLCQFTPAEDLALYSGDTKYILIYEITLELRTKPGFSDNQSIFYLWAKAPILSKFPRSGFMTVMSSTHTLFFTFICKFNKSKMIFQAMHFIVIMSLLGWLNLLGFQPGASYLLGIILLKLSGIMLSVVFYQNARYFSRG